MNLGTLLDTIIAFAFAIYFIAVAAFFVWTGRRHGWLTGLSRLRSPRLLSPLLILIPLYLVSASVVFLLPQEMGVVVSAAAPKGFRDHRLESGLRLIVPFVERVVIYPLSAQTYTLSRSPLEGEQVGDNSITARTSDGQEVALDISVIYRLDPNQVVQLHIRWQNRYERDLLRPLLQGLVRRRVAGFTVDEVNSMKRQILEAKITEDLSGVMEEQGLILDQFLLRNIEFTPEYAASVERKQVALQQAAQSKHEADTIRLLAQGQADQVRTLAQAEAEAEVVRANADAEAAVTRAQADAKALALIAGPLENNPDLLTYQYIGKISPNIRVMLVPNNAPLLLPLGGLAAETATDIAPPPATPAP